MIQLIFNIKKIFCENSTLSWLCFTVLHCAPKVWSCHSSLKVLKFNQSIVADQLVGMKYNSFIFLQIVVMEADQEMNECAKTKNSGVGVNIYYICMQQYQYVVVAKHTWATSVTDTVATPPKLSTTDGPNGKNPPETKLKLNHT